VKHGEQPWSDHSLLASANPSRGSVRFLSAVSIWETILLLEKKKIEIEQDFSEWFERSRRELELQEAPFDWKVFHELRFMMARVP
jgi:PIN domain nuclease of toxin-antitoxin system